MVILPNYQWVNRQINMQCEIVFGWIHILHIFHFHHFMDVVAYFWFHWIRFCNGYFFPHHITLRHVLPHLHRKIMGRESVYSNQWTHNESRSYSSVCESKNWVILKCHYERIAVIRVAGTNANFRREFLSCSIFVCHYMHHFLHSWYKTLSNKIQQKTH